VKLAICLMAAAILTAPPAHAGEVIEVKVGDLAYAPAKITAHVGDTVQWKNGDSSPIPPPRPEAHSM
jgi:plastocyanin